MPDKQPGRVPRGAWPKLGAAAPDDPVLLYTNVFVNGLGGRGPPLSRGLLRTLPRFFVAGPALAELSWLQGRLDPDHANTGLGLAAHEAMPSRVDPAKILVPSFSDWLAGGELAGRAARAIAGGGRKIATAFDRVELISDALTAVVAAAAGCVIITEDAHFAVLAQLLPGLRVLFYDRVEAV